MCEKIEQKAPKRGLFSHIQKREQKPPAAIAGQRPVWASKGGVGQPCAFRCAGAFELAADKSSGKHGRFFAQVRGGKFALKHAGSALGHFYGGQFCNHKAVNKKVYKLVGRQNIFGFLGYLACGGQKFGADGNGQYTLYGLCCAFQVFQPVT